MIDIMRIQIVASRGRGVREGEKGLKRNESDGAARKTIAGWRGHRPRHPILSPSPRPNRTLSASNIAGK